MSEVIESSTAAPAADATTAPIAQNPDLANPENPSGAPAQEADTTAKPEPTAAEKEAARLRRRIDRLTAERYRNAAEIDQLRRSQHQAAPAEAPAEGEHHQPQQRLTQEDVTRFAKAQVQAERFNQRCNDVAAEGEKANPRFREHFQTLADEVGGLFDANGFPTSFMNALLDSDVPTHKLISHLAENPDLAAEIADLSPTRQAKRLALIESELKAPKPQQASNAPKALKPVAPAAAPGTPDPKDTKAWIAHRNAQKR